MDWSVHHDYDHTAVRVHWQVHVLGLMVCQLFSKLGVLQSTQRVHHRQKNVSIRSMNAERLHINTFERNVVRLQRNKNQHDKEEFLFSRSNSFMLLASSQETAQQLIGKQTDEVRIVGGNQYMFSRNQPDDRVICVNCPTRH
jgi:hypothetical protein